MNRIISFCAALWIFSLLGFLIVMIFSFSYPNSSIGDLFGNRQQNLTIGLIFYKHNKIPKSNPVDQSLLALNQRILNITLAAIKDINGIVVNERAQNIFMSPKLPFINGLLLTNSIEDVSFHDTTSRIGLEIDRGTRIFLLGCFPRSWMDLISEFFESTGCEECVVVSPCSWPSSKETEVVPYIINTGMSEKETALAFLELFKQANSLPKKSVDVVPVLRADNTSRSFLTMMKMLSEKRGREEDGTVGINWSDPVEYIPSKYPKSDAFQIVSDIGARLALSQENSVVFLISSENLNYIIDMSRLNRELTQRQWFVKDLSHIENLLAQSRLPKSKTEKFCSMVSLSSITYVDKTIDSPLCTVPSSSFSNKPVHKLPISDCRDLAFQHFHSSHRGSIYSEVLAYETICKIYKAFYKSSLTTHTSRNTLASLKNEFRSTPGTCSISTAAKLTYKPNSDEVQIVPDLGIWMIQGFVRVHDGLRTSYDPLYTHPMERSELAKVLNTFPQRNEDKGCNEIDISVWSHSTAFTPDTIFNFSNIEQFPKKALVLPATGGISLTVGCIKRIKNETKTYNSVYTCVPKQYDVGNLSCITLKNQLREGYGSRKTRNTRALSTTINEFLNFTHFSKLIKENSSHAISIALKNTRKLLPNIMSCGASVAGCDYCMYFLTTYNLTVSPAACVGGCSLGTFASCSSLLGTSFVNTYLSR